jgi:hypothetical protein
LLPRVTLEDEPRACGVAGISAGLYGDVIAVVAASHADDVVVATEVGRDAINSVGEGCVGRAGRDHHVALSRRTSTHTWPSAPLGAAVEASWGWFHRYP